MGNVYTSESMLAWKTEALETALWVALNTLEEKVRRCRGGSPKSPVTAVTSHAAACFEERARKIREQADLIPQALSNAVPDTTRGIV